MLIKQSECSSIFMVHTWYKILSFIAQSILKNVQGYATRHLSVKKYTLMEMSDLLYNRTFKPSVVIKQTAVNLTMI